MLTIYCGQYFTISHCRDCDIPGYMIVSLQRSMATLAEANATERAELFNGLAVAERALTTLFSPEKIYLMRFSELSPEVHFHIFPRYAAMTDLYLEESNEPVIDGPNFFSWARKKFSSSRPEPTQEILQARWMLKDTISAYLAHPL